MDADDPRAWTFLRQYFAASSVLLLAWATVFGAALIGTPRSGAGWQLVTSVVLLVLSSAGTLISALWLKLERRAHGHRQTLLVELFWAAFVMLGAISAWSATSRPDVFGALYLIAPLWSFSIIRSPGKRLPSRVSVPLVSGIAFCVIALGHVVRLLAQTPLTIGWWAVPEWISVMAALAAGVLAWLNLSSETPR